MGDNGIRRESEVGMNPQDANRDKIIRFLYERQRSARGITKIPIGVNELKAEMKKRYGMSQQEVSSNLDYLIQSGWVRRDTRPRRFRTKKGTEMNTEQVKYKISDVGINHLEAGTVFRPRAAGQINVTTIEGVTVLGDGNIVNSEFAPIWHVLDELEEAIQNSKDMNDERKLDATADVATLRTQAAKRHPDKAVIQAAWKSLQAVAAIASVTDVMSKLGGLIHNILR